MSRGNAKQTVFHDDADREAFLRRLAQIGNRCQWNVFAYCLMNNHYHLCLETASATLAKGMRDLNGVYAQSFNRRYGRVGHVFQSRYRAVIVEGSSQLLEVIRYIVLNPVRAQLCSSPEGWLWSSHLATLGRVTPPPSLITGAVLRHFSGDLQAARSAYAAFVRAGLPAAASSLRSDNPIASGSQGFVHDVMAHLPEPTPEVPRRQRASRSLAHYCLVARSRDQAIRNAWSTGLFSLADIGRHFGLHYSTVSKICRSAASSDPGGGSTLRSTP